MRRGGERNLPDGGRAALLPREVAGVLRNRQVQRHGKGSERHRRLREIRAEPAVERQERHADHASSGAAWRCFASCDGNRRLWFRFRIRRIGRDVPGWVCRGRVHGCAEHLRRQQAARLERGTGRRRDLLARVRRADSRGAESDHCGEERRAVREVNAHAELRPARSCRRQVELLSRRRVRVSRRVDRRRHRRDRGALLFLCGIPGHQGARRLSLEISADGAELAGGDGVLRHGRRDGLCGRGGADDRREGKQAASAAVRRGRHHHRVHRHIVRRGRRVRHLGAGRK